MGNGLCLSCEHVSSEVGERIHAVNDESSQVDMKVMPITERIFDFTAALTFDEYLEIAPLYQLLLRARYQETRLPVADQLFLAQYSETLHFLAVVADDSPDTVAVLPVLAHIVAAAPCIDLRIVREDLVRDEEPMPWLVRVVDDPQLLDSLPDMDLPLLLILDEDWQVQEVWGPHPQAVEPKLDLWLEQYPDYERLTDDDSPKGQEQYAQLLDQLTAEMRVWYNSGLDRECVAEIREILTSLQSDDTDDEEE